MFKKLELSHNKNLTPMETRAFAKNPIEGWRNSIFFPVLSYAFGIRWDETKPDFHIPESEWSSTFSKDEFSDFIHNLGQSSGVRSTQRLSVKRLFSLLFLNESSPEKQPGISLRSELKPLIPISQALIERVLGGSLNSLSIRVMAKLTTLALKVLVPSVSLWQELRILWRKGFSIFNEN